MTAVSCPPGFVPATIQFRQCLGDLTWWPPSLGCEAVECDPPSNDTFLSLTWDGNTTAWTTVTYSCQPGQLMNYLGNILWVEYRSLDRGVTYCAGEWVGEVRSQCVETSPGLADWDLTPVDLPTQCSSRSTFIE